MLTGLNREQQKWQGNTMTNEDYMNSILNSTCKGRSCGQACLAMMSGKSESEIHEMFWPDRGMTTLELLWAMFKLRINTILPKKNINKDSDCVIVVKTAERGLHCVIRYNGRIYDPMCSTVSQPNLDPSYTIMVYIETELKKAA